MHFTHLQLSNFRLYRSLSLELPEGLNVFWGANAQGKTALLEALYLLATSRSFRTQSEVELVRWDEEVARISSRLARDSGRERRLEFAWQRQGQKVTREVRLMGQPVRKLGEFLGEVLLTLFVPGDLSLIQGGPQERRRFLDLTLCKLYPTYLAALSQYQRVIKQRNELLKRGHAAGELEPWDLLLVQNAGQLMARRHELALDLDGRFQRLYRRLSREEAPLSLTYAPNSTELEADLMRRRAEELRLRTSLVGPHRDELQVRLGSRSLRRFGSQGQQRTAVLALRLAEAEVLTERSGESAMVLLDDCLSELDPSRQERLLDSLTGYRQVFLTTAVPVSGLPGTLWRVEAGQIAKPTPC